MDNDLSILDERVQREYAEICRIQDATNLILQETVQSIKETDRKMQQIDREIQQVNRQMGE